MKWKRNTLILQIASTGTLFKTPGLVPYNTMFSQAVGFDDAFATGTKNKAQLFSLIQ